MRGAGSTASGDPKNAHLRRLEGAPESLLLFKADVLDRDALAAAVAGCEGVFHVASPVPADKVLDPEASTNLDAYRRPEFTGFLLIIRCILNRLSYISIKSFLLLINICLVHRAVRGVGSCCQRHSECSSGLLRE